MECRSPGVSRSPSPSLPAVAGVVDIIENKLTYETLSVNNVDKDTYEAGIEFNPTHGYARWDITDTPLWYTRLPDFHLQPPTTDRSLGLIFPIQQS